MLDMDEDKILMQTALQMVMMSDIRRLLVKSNGRDVTVCGL